jgi:3-hydroxyisobutyrate dehydrogenase-like beta-hydroxyacid dehydrogenase
MSSETIAILGAGLIGAGMAEAARSRGLDVAVWNRTRAKADALAPLGVRPCATIDEAVRGASRVHVAVADDAAVDAILSTAVPALGEGCVVLDHTTASPAGTAARAARAAREGWAFLHAPVFMSPAMAKAAKGMILCAGPTATYERVKDALAAMTGDVWYLGERPDLAAAYKLFGNAMIITVVGGLADVFAMASTLGVPPEAAHQLFSRFKPATTIDLRGAKMAVGDYTPAFELTMARKDVRLMLEAAGDAPMAVLPAIAARMDELIRRGDGGLDLAALSRDSIPPKS